MTHAAQFAFLSIAESSVPLPEMPCSVSGSVYAAVSAHGHTCSMEKKQGLWPNAWLLVLAFLAALPVIIAQSLIAWIETVFPKRRWDLDSGMLGHYMLSAYFIGTPQQCSSSGLQG